MTISTSSSAIIVAGNDSNTSFAFPFIANQASDIAVTAIASNGAMTILNPSQYTLIINSPAVNQLWGVGGLITYPLNGDPLPTGQNLLIQRTVPLTQPTTVRNQGNYYAQVTEQALDTLCMEIQQVASRTGQIRGTWATNVGYNFGDVVVDGANGNNTQNLYMCANANTSSVWATDLADGDWSLVLNIQAINAVIGAYLPLTGGTISGGLTVTGSASISGNLTVGGTISGSVTPSNNSITNAMLSQMASNTVKLNNTSGLSNAVDFALGSSTLLGRGSVGNIAVITTGNGLSIINTTLNTIPGAYAQSSPSNPTGTSSTSAVMMGLGGSITPAVNGVIMVTINGNYTNSTSSDGIKYQIRYGTGAAPSNAASPTGSIAGPLIQNTNLNNSNVYNFTLSSIVSNLTVGTSYWFDLAAAAVTGGTATITNVGLSAFELH